jgi:RNA polymerase sigma factor (sigma-70 family)
MQRMDQDVELIESALQGNAAALDRLMLSYYDDVLRFIQSHMPPQLSHRLGAEDILQATYAKVFRSLGSFHAESAYSFKSWVRTIAQNILRDEIRCNSRDSRQRPQSGLDTVSLVHPVDVLNDDEPEPAEEARRRELVRATHLALGRLEPHYREALELQIEGKSLHEIAQEMKLGVEAARGVVYRARQKLKDEICRLSLYI